MKWQRLLAIGLLVAFGAIRIPFEQRLTQENRAAFFHGAKLDLDMRQELPQLGFLAALSGFRAIVADVLWLQAHTAWERTEWYKMISLFNTVTALQPRAILFWDTAGWHLGWNMSVAMRENPDEPREALRIKAQREAFRLAEDLYLRGIQNNPDRALLYDRLGMLYKDKFQDHLKAFEAYDRGKDLPDAYSYVRRFAAFELALVPGREKEAYERLMALYRAGKDEWVPTLFTRLAEVEERLGIPEEQRVKRPSREEMQ